MTDRIRFDPEPISWHVPPSQRGWLEFAPEPEHPQLTRIWLKGDGSNAPQRHAHPRRHQAHVRRLAPDADAPGSEDPVTGAPARRIRPAGQATGYAGALLAGDKAGAPPPLPRGRDAVPQARQQTRKARPAR
jgi:hypothetical protein